MKKIKKLINNLTDNKKIITIFIVFLIIQPILDIYILFTDDVINIFKFSPATIIRIIVIMGLFILYVFSDKNRKHLKYWILYAIIIIVYTIIHLYNCLEMNNFINSAYRVSIISEIFYIIRMMLPLFIAYISFNYKMSFKELSLIITSVILIFCIILIFSHFTKTSLKSYVEGNEKISQTVFDWIFNSDNVTKMEDSLSKGIFRGANQLGNLLAMLLPIMLYITVRKTNFINCLTTFLQVFSCILIGTRVASLTWIMVFACFILMIIYFSLIKKHFKVSKFIWIYFIIIFLFNGYVLSKSPTWLRKFDDSETIKAIQEKNNTESSMKDINRKISENLISSKNALNELEWLKNEILDFIEKNYTQFGIQKIFIIDIYNYHCDPLFWIDIMNSSYDTYNNSRKMQFRIAERIFELNDNVLDIFVGIGFSTTRNGQLYTEKDFYAHYYTLGTVGLILFIIIQIILLVIAIIKMFFYWKNKFNLENVVYIMSLIMIYGIALISAHVLDELIVTIFIGFVLGQLLNNIFINKEIEE